MFRLINYLKKVETLALKDISDIEHGVDQKKKQCYTHKTYHHFDRTNPEKTLKKKADIVKLGQAIEMPPEEEHLLTNHSGKRLSYIKKHQLFLKLIFFGLVYFLTIVSTCAVLV